MKKRFLSVAAASVLIAGMAMVSGCGGSSAAAAGSKTVRGTVAYVGPVANAPVTVYGTSRSERVLCTAVTDVHGDFECTYNSGTPTRAVVAAGATDIGFDADTTGDDILIPEDLSGTAQGDTINISLAKMRGVEDTPENRIKLYAYTQALMLTDASLGRAAAEEAAANKIKGISSSAANDIRDRIFAMVDAQLGNGADAATLLTIKAELQALNTVAGEDGILDSSEAAAVQAVLDSASVLRTAFVNALNDQTAGDIDAGAAAETVATRALDPNGGQTTTPPQVKHTCPPPSNTPGVKCGPRDERLKFATHFDNGGILMTNACMTAGNFSKKCKNHKIEQVLASRKYIRLNQAAQALDTDGKFNVIKDYLTGKFTLGCCSKDMGLTTADEGKKFVASMVLNFPETNCPSCKDTRPEYMAIMFELDAIKDANGNLVLKSPANSKIVGTFKMYNGNEIQVTDVNDVANLVHYTEDNNGYVHGAQMMFDPAHYFQKVIDKIEAGNAQLAEKFKEMLVRNTTKACPFEIYLGMSEMKANNNFTDFVKNPGTIDPSDFGMNQGQNNPYKGAYQTPIHAMKFKICLN